MDTGNFTSLEEYKIDRKPDSEAAAESFRDFYQKFRLQYSGYMHSVFLPGQFFLTGMDGEPVQNPAPSLVFSDPAVYYDPVFHDNLYKIMKGMVRSLISLPPNLFVYHISGESLTAPVLHFALYTRRHDWILDLAYACAGYETDHPELFICAAVILLFRNDKTQRAEYFFKKSGYRDGVLSGIYKSLKHKTKTVSGGADDVWTEFHGNIVKGRLSGALRHMIMNADKYRNYKAVNAALFHHYFINGKMFPYLKKTAEISALPYPAQWAESLLAVKEVMNTGWKEFHTAVNETKSPESLPDDSFRKQWAAAADQNSSEDLPVWAENLLSGGEFSSEFPFYLYRGYYYRLNFDSLLADTSALDLQELRSLAGESFAARALLAVHYTEEGDFQKSSVYLRGLPSVHPAVIRCREKNILPHIHKKFSRGG